MGKSMRGRAAGVLAAAILSLSFGGAAPASAAWPVSCATPGQANYFLGNGKSGSTIDGVYSEIEYVPKNLCAQGSTLRPSWSLAWISIDGVQTNQTPGIDIFQGGYAQCANLPAGMSCPYNSGLSYFWWYYGHEQGPCGNAFNTGVVRIRNNSSGIHDFQISLVSSYYRFYIDEVEVTEARQSMGSLDTCWEGRSGVEWQSEMLNPGDQAGGRDPNHQTFRENQWHNAAGWHGATRVLGSDCDANSDPALPRHWHCQTSTAYPDIFYAWDDR